jgi:hypothetical protein
VRNRRPCNGAGSKGLRRSALAIGEPAAGGAGGQGKAVLKSPKEKCEKPILEPVFHTDSYATDPVKRE